MEPFELVVNPEFVDISVLKPHPRNYRNHPEDQINHLIQRIKEFGLYKTIITANDYTILIGHGLYKALQRMGMTTIPIKKVNLDPNSPAAIKLLTGDNETAKLAEVDDRLLSELLKEVKDFDVSGLLGTGFDEFMLANLVFVTRPENEIQTINEAAEWVGMPEYIPKIDPLKLTVAFLNEEDRKDFADKLGIELSEKTKSIWWPLRDRDDVASIRIEG